MTPDFDFLELNEMKEKKHPSKFKKKCEINVFSLLEGANEHSNN